MNNLVRTLINLTVGGMREEERRYLLNGRMQGIVLCRLVWSALEEMASREGLTVEHVIEQTMIACPDMSLANALELCAVRYWRGVGTEISSPRQCPD